MSMDERRILDADKYRIPWSLSVVETDAFEEFRPVPEMVMASSSTPLVEFVILHYGVEVFRMRGAPDHEGVMFIMREGIQELEKALNDAVSLRERIEEVLRRS